jgi:hypothetical protein
MAATKYGKYFLREPFGAARHPEIKSRVIHIGQDADLGGANFPITTNFSITMEAVHQAFSMTEKSHVHDFDEILCFVGGNPMDFRDFGAEVELSLGEELEKHIITTTTFVYVPKGLIHCPIRFKRVDKPIIFSAISLAPVYEKTLIPNSSNLAGAGT